MSTPNEPSRSGENRLKKRWFAYFGANSLFISILLHVLFGVGVTYLIVEHFQKKHINFHSTEPVSQHMEVEYKVELAKRNNVESAPPDLKRIVTTDVSAITLPEPHLKIGPVFHVNANEAMDMDVLIGDDGGICNFFLLIEKEGEIYGNGDGGFVAYPFFQIGDRGGAEFDPGDEHPPYSSNSYPWQEADNPSF